MTTAELLEKLQTAEGQALLTSLTKQLEPHTNVGSGTMMEPRLGQPLPGADVFEQKLIDGLCNRFTRTGEVREATVAVVAHELSQLADSRGVVNSQTVLKVLGPKGLQFVEQLAQIERKSGDPLADRRAFDPLDASTAAAIARQAPIAPKMAAMEAMVKHIATKDELKGLQFMGLQHLFASSGTLFQAIADLGVKHQDMRLIGKVYSTNHRVVAELESRGATVDNVSKRVGARAFEHAMAESIEWQLKQIVDKLPQPTVFTAEGPQFAEQPTPTVLLIDDGAEAIKILHERFPAYAPFFLCVEQTRRGARILHELEEKRLLKCAVANVAETWAKLEWESPMIGHSVVLELDRKLDRLEKAGVPAAKDSLVLGCGAVGGGVARAMVRRGMDVHLYDKDNARADALKEAMVKEGLDAAKIHVHQDKAGALAHGHVVVSCVGVRTIDRDDHDHLPNGAILVNAASADDELGPQDLLPFRKKGANETDERGNMWSTFRGVAVNTGKASAEAHSDAVVQHPNGKEFFIINHGYVVNMTGERDPIPPRYIQLTRALLLLGALTAKRAAAGEGGGVGIHDVPKEWQEGLVNLVQRELKKTGEDLQTPSWETKASDAWAEEERLTPPAAVAAFAALERKGLVTAANPLSPEPLPPGVTPERLQKSEVVGVTDDLMAKVVAVNQRKTPPVDGERLYGLKLGEAKRGSAERTIAGFVDGGTALSLEGAALYKATVAVNAHFKVSLRASLQAPGGQASPLFVDPARTTFTEGKLVIAGTDETPKERFEALVGHFTRALVEDLLASRLKRVPTAAEVAEDLKAVFANQGVDVTPWVQKLARSSDTGDQALLATGIQEAVTKRPRRLHHSLRGPSNPIDSIEGP